MEKKQSFDREKIRRGFMKATWKRLISIERINHIIDEVEAKLRVRNLKQVKSWEIGNLVPNLLKRLDQVSLFIICKCLS